jgi:galactofuranose transport system ATP-binding protein
LISPVTQPPLLEARGLCKRFPGVIALDGVDLSIRAGEVHALLGENGAGKSTLIKVLTGAYQKDAGVVELGGRRIDPKTPAHAQRFGISTVYQEVNLLPNLSVAQNIFLGREPKRRGFVDTAEMRRRSAALLRQLDLDIDPKQTLDTFPVGIRQLIAIARAVDMSARLLILDEPTASLDAREVDRLFSIIRRLRADDVGIVFITHFIDQVYAIADRITVLRNGRKVGTFEARELPRPKLIEHMLGREVQALEAAAPAARNPAAGDPVIELRNVGVERSVGRLSFTVEAGEAVGLSGLLGAGRTETCRVIFALDQPDTGDILFRGRRVRPRDPRAAIALGIALCPEDRREQGIVGALSVRENIVLALQARRGWWRRIGRRRETALGRKAVEDLRIATASLETPIEHLSGGNQQKAILGRWLTTDPVLLILDEPTRGIDIGAHAEILRLIRSLCERGMALVVASSELEELVAFSHKVVVLRDRVQVAALEGTEISEQNIMHAIAGADEG